MNKGKNISVAFLILGLLGCAALPPKPLDPQRGVIGISVKTRAPVKVFTMMASKVYFVKAEENEDLYSQENFIESTYAKGGQVYLLNAEPGRYAAVACYKKKVGGMRKDEYTIFFPKELIKLTEVTVAPGMVAFMGKYVVDSSTSFKYADPCEFHYLQVIAPAAVTGIKGSVAMSLLTGHGEYYYKGSLHEEHCDKDTEIRFVNNALNHFKGSDWENIIQKRMEELKAEK
jgi:hypothetical protein